MLNALRNEYLIDTSFGARSRGAPSTLELGKLPFLIMKSGQSVAGIATFLFRPTIKSLALVLPQLLVHISPSELCCLILHKL